MKEEIFILVIDDADQEATIHALELRLKKFCSPRIEQIHTGAIELRKNDGSDHLDATKLKALLEEKLKGRRIDWIATDFNLGEEEIDGIDIVRMMLNIRRFKHKNIILYSGNIQSAIRKILNEAKTSDSEDDIISAVEKFIELPILSFNGRQDYKDILVELISKNNHLSLEDKLLKLLYTHKDKVFNSCFPPFAGKTFGEIAEIVENESDARSEEWLHALIDQTMAYLLQVNE